MLHRCVATNRCCPKLHEEDYSGDAPPHAAHLYSNPYMHEDFVHHSALRFSMQEDGVDFPPSALGLMYEPPVDDTDDISEGNHSDGYVQDVDDLLNVPKLISSSSPPKIHGQQRAPEGAPANGVGVFLRRVGPKPADSSEVGDEGAASQTRSSSAPRLAAPGRPRLVDRLPMRSMSSKAPGRETGGGKASPSGSGSCGSTETSSADGSALRPSATSRPRPGASPGRRAPSAVEPGARLGPGSGSSLGPVPASAALGGLGAPVQVEPRTLSRSLRDARACTSEAGAASIAAILDVVARAQEVPLQQRPNSEKWAQRLASYEFGVH